MLYHLLTYPLDVIKTNRILDSKLTTPSMATVLKEAVEIFDKGGLQKGLMRGMLMSFAIGSITQLEYYRDPIFFAPVVSVLQNPFNIL